LLADLEGGFALLAFDASVPTGAIAALAAAPIPCTVVQVGGSPTLGALRIEDKDGLLAQRYNAHPNTCFLLRPDQHICARWKRVRSSLT
jgi:3-(3-hydroxy-phenyl)propionate hydroxylase